MAIRRIFARRMQRARAREAETVERPRPTYATVSTIDTPMKRTPLRARVAESSVSARNPRLVGLD